MAELKAWRNLDEQIERLESRNMQILDHDKAKNYLSRIGYYRLSGYWYPFRKFQIDQKGRQDTFKDGTTFKHIIELYIFDKKLRLLALDAIERIEMAIRTDIAYVLGERSPKAHELPEHLHGNFTKRPSYNARGRYSTKSEHRKWLDRYDNLVSRSI